MEKVIAVDFDDTLVDCIRAVCAFHNDEYGTAFAPDDHYTYRFENIWGVSKDEAHRRINEFFESRHHNLMTPKEGALQVLKELSEEYALHVVTARPQTARESTLRVLENRFPNLFQDAHFCGTVSGRSEGKRSKREICKTIGAGGFIDDAIHHVHDVAALPHVRTFLFEAPWNKGADGLAPGIRRVLSWEEVRGFIQS